MTWIVGTPSLFGYSILVSDICVTFKDKLGKEVELDCLQKIYPLCKFVIGGFSGSVKIGFNLLGALSSRLSNIPDDSAWVVNIIANTWLPRLCRHIYSNSDESEKRLGSGLILASVHPTKDRLSGRIPWSDIHVFSAPEFSPRRAKNLEVLSIGTGAKAYAEVLKGLSGNFDLMKGNMLGETGQVNLLASSINRLFQDSPTQGISSLFQVSVVMRRKCALQGYEYTVYSRGGEKQEVRLPRIARSYEEFGVLSKTLRRRYESASC